MKHIYNVEYKMYDAGEVLRISVTASTKLEAYNTAMYDAIPKQEGGQAYSAWVGSVTLKNGELREFNTFEGKPV